MRARWRCESAGTAPGWSSASPTTGSEAPIPPPAPGCAASQTAWRRWAAAANLEPSRRRDHTASGASAAGRLTLRRPSRAHAKGQRGLRPDGSIWADEPIYGCNPPQPFVEGWRSLYHPRLADEDESRVTWEAEAQGGGYRLMTVTHDRLESSPNTADSVPGTG
jgi:hypothetical protein